MSSGFVAAGTNDRPVQRDEEWLKAQQEIEEARRHKAAEGVQEGGKSLYDVLQGNKAAKQEAFEEAAKLKNQFRNLEEDEVDFLDSVLESTRAKEEEVRRETAKELEAFKRQQEEADKAVREEDAGAEVAKAASPIEDSPHWVVGPKKRKRVQQKEALKGVKLRKSSSATQDASEVFNVVGKKSSPSADTKVEAQSATELSSSEPTLSKSTTATVTSSTDPKDPKDSTNSSTSLGLGLAGYSSDETD